MKKRRLGAADAAFGIPAYALLAGFTLLCIFPFYYMLINSISGNDLVKTGQILFYPREIHFKNYQDIFRLNDIVDAALVSFARTAIGTASCVLCTSFVAYVLSKKELWLRRVWYRFFVVTLYLNVGIVPWFINMQMLGLTDNFLAYVIGVVNPYNMVLTKAYVESLPPSLEESAEIDGAGPLRVFFRIILPLSKPIIATTAVFTAVLQWNSFTDTLILMHSSKLYTLQFILWRYLQSAPKVPPVAGPGGAVYIMPSITSIKMTISMVVVLPILFVYPFFQRYFVKGIMLGAVKG
ncbi:MAG: carbohydrate ABC transporter permease [Clostridiales bacterium]|nr:carbohydrate ABC transporter permease [Clostridiales bacterium]